MPRRAASPLLAILAAGLVGFALGYASEAAAEGRTVSRGAVSGGGAAFGERMVRVGGERTGRAAGIAAPRRSGLAVSGVATRAEGRGYRRLERPRNTYRTEGSLTHVGRGSRDAPFPEGFDEAVHDGGYEVFYADDGFPAPGSFPSEAKIVDIATARLDGRPTVPVDTILTGGTKIIRIGPDDRRRTARAGLAASRRGDRQPWSTGWLTHCMAAYASFDPALGTYIAGDGRVRFCEAE